MVSVERESTFHDLHDRFFKEVRAIGLVVEWVLLKLPRLREGIDKGGSPKSVGLSFAVVQRGKCSDN